MMLVLWRLGDFWAYEKLEKSNNRHNSDEKFTFGGLRRDTEPGKETKKKEFNVPPNYFLDFIRNFQMKHRLTE